MGQQSDKGAESTIIIWESLEALKSYRESDLVQEAMAFEKKTGMPTTREAYPILSALWFTLPDPFGISWSAAG
jgi:heme-degrading monooxygenase HmoA